MVFLKKLVLALFLFLIPFTTKASVVINEIMYDLEGSDSGREWIEVYNNGSENVNLTNWKFFENNTNHKLTLFQGNAILAGHNFAIITDDPIKFLEDWPNFSGTIFDSSFSLSNTGEKIALVNENGEIVDEVNYSSEWGANGNGKSLQRINSIWKEGLPTPGCENDTSSSSSQNSSTNSEIGNDSSNTSSDTGSLLGNENYQENEENYQNEFSKLNEYEENKKTSKQNVKKSSTPNNSVEIIPKEKIALINTSFSFIPAVKILGQEKKEGFFYWNFGDGYTLSLENNSSVNHLYEYPGNYLISLKYCSTKSSNDCYVGNISLKVITPEILIKNVGDEKKFFVEIFNQSNFDLNISNFFIIGKEKAFIIPEGTIILSKSSLIFSPKLTGFNISDKNFLKILYPNLETLYDYSTKNDSYPNFAIKTISSEKNKPSLENQNQTENLFQKNIKNNFEKYSPKESLSDSSLKEDRNNLLANVSEVSENSDKNNFLKYLLILTGIVLVTVASIFFLRGERNIEKISQERKIAEEVEIIEDKEFPL